MEYKNVSHLPVEEVQALPPGNYAVSYDQAVALGWYDNVLPGDKEHHWAQRISDGALASLGRQPEPIPWIDREDFAEENDNGLGLGRAPLSQKPAP